MSVAPRFSKTRSAGLLCASLSVGACSTDNPLFAGDASGRDRGSVTDDEGTTPAEDSGTTVGADQAVDPAALPPFSFFVTSLAALRELSGSQDGFGGDLRFGETGPGAGLRGADKLCAAIAERSMPGAAAKQWRAFLSVTADDSGQPVNAIDRVGEGPWYDRLGRLLAPTRADLLGVRPENGDPAIRDDLPNEDGVPNHQPDPSLPPVDNHHFLTGSNQAGALLSATATCKDWTTADGSYSNGRPMCGFSWPRNTGGKPGPGGDAANWKTGFAAPGCAPGVSITESGGAAPGSDSVGDGGGYGGFYCFALVP